MNGEKFLRRPEPKGEEVEEFIRKNHNSRMFTNRYLYMQLLIRIFKHIHYYTRLQNINMCYAQYIKS